MNIEDVKIKLIELAHSHCITIKQKDITKEFRHIFNYIKPSETELKHCSINVRAKIINMSIYLSDIEYIFYLAHEIGHYLDNVENFESPENYVFIYPFDELNFEKQAWNYAQQIIKKISDNFFNENEENFIKYKNECLITYRNQYEIIRKGKLESE